MYKILFLCHPDLYRDRLRVKKEYLRGKIDKNRGLYHVTEIGFNEKCQQSNKTIFKRLF